MSLTNQSQPCSPYIKSPLLWHFLSNSCFSVQDFHTLTSLFFSQMFTIVCIPSPPETKFHNDRTHVCSVPRYLHSVWNHIRLLACAPWICNETRNDSFVLDLSRILRYVAWASLTPAGAKARVLIYIRQEVRWSRTGKHANSAARDKIHRETHWTPATFLHTVTFQEWFHGGCCHSENFFSTGSSHKKSEPLPVWCPLKLQGFQVERNTQKSRKTSNKIRRMSLGTTAPPIN